MKKYITLALLFVLLHQVQAQDKIVKTNGEELAAHVLEITLQEVIYRHPDSAQTGVFRQLPKAEVFMVQFANGTKEVFSENLPAATTAVAALSPEQMYNLGRQDAIKYYKGNGAMWGSAASTVLFPYGLAGPLIIGLVPPKAPKNGVSDHSYLSDPVYVKGYETQARKKKTGKVLAGTGIGLSVVLVSVMVLLASVY